MAAIPMAPLSDVSRYSVAPDIVYDLPRVAATELLTQVCNQQPEALKNERMLALRIAANSLLENLVGSLMAIVCTLRLHRMGDTIGHAVSSSHDGRLEAQETLFG
jgi:hypothetical protein